MRLYLLSSLLLCAIAQTMQQGIGTSKPPSSSGGTGTISFITSGAGGPGISPTGQTTGDLLMITQSSNNTSPASSLSVTSGCSSSGTFAGATAGSGGNAVQNSGIWCIVSAASPVFTSSNCTPGCRVTYYAFRSTNGWNTSSFVQGTAAAVADANPVVGVSVVVPGTKFLVFGELGQQDVVETLSASGSWTLGNQSAGGQVSAEVYQMNVNAATYTPSVGRNTASATNWVSLSVAMSTN